MNKAIPITQKAKSPIKQTAADSTFIRKNHPVYTGGYLSRTFKEMDERDPKLPKPTRQMESDHAQANKIREQQAISRAKKTGIDVSNMKASEGSAKAGKKVRKAVSPLKDINNFRHDRRDYEKSKYKKGSSPVKHLKKKNGKPKSARHIGLHEKYGSHDKFPSIGEKAGDLVNKGKKIVNKVIDKVDENVQDFKNTVRNDG
jgi:hypothetical protein